MRVVSTSCLRAFRFISDEKLSIKELPQATPHDLTGQELPLLVLWISCLSKDAIRIFADLLC